MDISTYLLGHYIMLVELIGLWAMVSMGVHINTRTVIVTRYVIIMIFVESILWSIEKWTQDFEKLSPARPILTSTIYLMFPIIVIAVMEMLEPIGRKMAWIFIPFIISVPLIYTSQWTHLFFWYTEDNKYIANGILGIYPYILFGIYVLLFVNHYISYYFKYSKSVRVGILYVIIASIIGVLIHVIFESDTDYSTLFASVVVIYYLFLYMHTSKYDSLTKMLNRQCYYYDSKNRVNKISGVVSADMNELKWINDEYGHEAGDNALKTVARCLTEECGRNKEAYRVGGDEFIIFYFNVNKDYIKKDVQMMRDSLADTAYTCAFGYAMMPQDLDIDSVIRSADRAMYEDKTKIKNRIVNSGGVLHNRKVD
ncbi:MAG: GGDEF domain-containing protein [Lachnospiraceae bacterium]|nr:GGDEF domain-containing protein [Lachnospiraceae bacterium]